MFLLLILCKLNKQSPQFVFHILSGYYHTHAVYTEANNIYEEYTGQCLHQNQNGIY